MGWKIFQKKLDTQIINVWNDFDICTTGGHVKLITIKILTSHTDIPLRFTINGRGFDEPLSLIVRFHAVPNLDPDINRYVVNGAGSNNFKFYIAKETTSTWNIYAQHVPYQTLFTTQAEYARYMRKELFDVTYPNVLVDTLPDGSLEFATEARSIDT
ncbi:MAG: hypothetical protein OSJ45_04105 [Lachnospiraceae bacterium]|nr:hypothetical protein [Lachnospiraceae bacterium]